MNLISKLTVAGAIFLTIPALVAADDSMRGGKKKNNKVTQSKDSSTTLDAAEASHLTFMREEEKLARDVYLQFAEWYPGQPTFSNIATKSEQTHTDTMRDRLALYNLEDPNPDTNNLPESLGVFTGEEWGEYFDEKFGELTKAGSGSELDALYVGAFIEELDMHDIADCPQVMLDSEEVEYPDPCGLNYTDEPGIINAYNSLIDGSENHLRAYVGKIEAAEGYCTYGAQYLSQEDVDAILGRTCE
jgi:hypothetical protein